MTKAAINEAPASGIWSAMLQNATTERQVEFANTVLKRALALFQGGQLESADVLLETMERDPLARQRVLHIRGVIALRRGEDEKALDFLEEAIRLDPSDADAHANLAQILLHARQYPQAFAAFAAALSLRPGSVAPLFGLARALVGVHLFDLAIDAYRDVLAIAPDHADAASELAFLAEQEAPAITRQTDKLTDPIMAAALRMTAVPQVAGPVLCDALFLEGCRHHRAQDVERARQFFERVLAIDSNHVNALCNLGAIETDLGHTLRAQSLLEAAVLHAPQFVPARVALANALLAGGKTEQAHAQYRIALELAPQSDAAHAQYALALYDLGDLDNAMSHFLDAAKISQQQSPRFYETLGCACAARGNSQGAEISLKHALALDPKRINAHCALGDLYLSLSRLGEAEVSFRNALAIDAEHVSAIRGVEQARSARPLEASIKEQ
jgi:tetratricopeptide (TPR) repeat protein